MFKGKKRAKVNGKNSINTLGGLDTDLDSDTVLPDSPKEPVIRVTPPPIPLRYFSSEANLGNPRVYREITMCGHPYRQYLPLHIRRYSGKALDVSTTLCENDFCPGEADIAKKLLEFESADEVNIATLTAVFTTDVPFKKEPRRKDNYGLF
jgi:hypothetical protein